MIVEKNSLPSPNPEPGNLEALVNALELLADVFRQGRRAQPTPEQVRKLRKVFQHSGFREHFQGWHLEQWGEEIEGFRASSLVPCDCPESTCGELEGSLTDLTPLFSDLFFANPTLAHAAGFDHRTMAEKAHADVVKSRKIQKDLGYDQLSSYPLRTVEKLLTPVGV